ncbi:sulfate adenylyltransferase subunit CysN [Thiomicrorhabdus indica]|uniref:sulfate adenylyltransferase subunit CysN n=1 Tax=Thiomicrorhabdus indica TaxID=2267253 RepID=UPI002AA8B8F7|nr:sulfate adenylyltransferase subunit CysN [Thiomicrorhabdus indica]
MAHQSQLIEENIESYLKQHEQKKLLRFITCGSVDDGKSTLIGRLLHDSKMVFEDQLAAISKDSKKHGTTGEEIDLALLVDGLQSEREQGITIDVAYRFFSTDKRKFIIADTPGHEQYTRNMATGASTADLAIILIDATRGVQTQTRRHSFITHLLGIRKVVIAVNKMDLVDYQQSVFQKICGEYLEFAKPLQDLEITFVPISALKGDNVVNMSEGMSWYTAKPLMEILDSIALPEQVEQDFCMPVQYVNRPNLDFRGFCGTIASGKVSVGDSVLVLPSKKETKVKEVIVPQVPKKDENSSEAFFPMAITLTLQDEIDISRGDLLVDPNGAWQTSDTLQIMLVWMHDTPLQLGQDYLIKRASSLLTGRVTNIDYQIDVNTLEKTQSSAIALNEIALVTLELNQPIAFDLYTRNKEIGSLIFIDKYSNTTLAAGMIQGSFNSIKEKTTRKKYSEFEIELNQMIREHYPEWGCLDIS